MYKFFFLVFFGCFISGQKILITPTVKVIYESTLKLGTKNNTQKEVFVLIGNSKDYYFAAQQNYLNDTKQYQSQGGIDMTSISDEFQERVIKYDDSYNVLFSMNDNKIRYKENTNSKWVLYSDTKVINGLKCQMAAINKFGRRWIAYFSKEYSQSLGPYKFSGLPGLILEIYDTKDDYHFTAKAIEKYSRQFEFNLSAYKNFSKRDYLVAKDNMEFGSSKYPHMSGEMKRETEAMLAKLKQMANNPLELKPFE